MLSVGPKRLGLIGLLGGTPALWTQQIARLITLAARVDYSACSGLLASYKQTRRPARPNRRSPLARGSARGGEKRERVAKVGVRKREVRKEEKPYPSGVEQVLVASPGEYTEREVEVGRGSNPRGALSAT